MTCPKCKGKGHTIIPVSKTIDGKRTDSSFEMDCDVCNGTGKVDLTEFIQWKQEVANEKALWCHCGNPSGEVLFYNDNECCPGDKHHWDCKDCGKLLQVG